MGDASPLHHRQMAESPVATFAIKQILWWSLRFAIAVAFGIWLSGYLSLYGPPDIRIAADQNALAVMVVGAVVGWILMKVFEKLANWALKRIAALPFWSRIVLFVAILIGSWVFAGASRFKIWLQLRELVDTGSRDEAAASLALLIGVTGTVSGWRICNFGRIRPRDILAKASHLTRSKQNRRMMVLLGVWPAVVIAYWLISPSDWALSWYELTGGSVDFAGLFGLLLAPPIICVAAYNLWRWAQRGE